ncbi:MAG: hypothetical protein ABR543_10400 [Gemmatimonadaceae bacterium]
MLPGNSNGVVLWLIESWRILAIFTRLARVKKMMLYGKFVQLAALALLYVAQTRVASAQNVPIDAAHPAFRCDGQPVSSISIKREPPTVIGRSAPQWSRPILSFLLQHRTTRPEAIRPFLLLKDGSTCTDFRRAESERLLRAQPYLADATVRAVPAGGDSVALEIETIDEIPIVVGLRVRNSKPSSIKFGNANLLGRGLYAAVEWEDGFAFRDGLGVTFVNYHMFGGPNQLAMQAERHPLGEEYGVALTSPFQTEFQRVAWHAGYANRDRFVAFLRSNNPTISLMLRRELSDIGGVFRLGRGGGRVFAGGIIAHERIEPADRGVVVTDTALLSDPDQTLAGRYHSSRMTRIAAVLGMRALSFRTVRGFDALIGPQDVGRGFQAAVSAGPVFGTNDGEYVGTDVYAAAGGQASFLAFRLRSEGRLDQTADRWVDVVHAGHLAFYSKASPKRTVIVSSAFTGAWRSRVPFQLTIGDREGGVRGYDGSRVAGARRAVLAVEHRWVVREVGRYAGFGVAGFADAGRMWRGSVPFGTHGTRASAGISLLGAVPTQSNRLLRVDFAVPIAPDKDAPSWDLRFTASRPLRTFWREPGDITQARAGVPATGIFAWP